MSKMGYCPIGGENGVLATRKELSAFAKRHGRKHIDEVIPLVTEPDQPLPSGCPNRNRHDDFGNAVYWETETGSHGWCCRDCGLVLQWG